MIRKRFLRFHPFFLNKPYLVILFKNKGSALIIIFSVILKYI